MNWINRNILWLSLVVFIIPIGIYWLKFRTAGMSNDPENWAEFGDFVGGVYSVLVTILAIYLARNLTLKDEAVSKRRDAIDDIFQQIAKIEQCADVNSKTYAVNKLIRLVHIHELQLSDSICYDIERLADYYLERIEGNVAEDIVLVSCTKDKLKKAYYGT